MQQQSLFAPADSHRCARCRKHKPRSLFPKSKRTTSGLRSWCSQCFRDYARDRRHARPEYQRREEARRVRAEYKKAGLLRCSKCGALKAVDEFHTRDNGAVYYSQCKPCVREQGSARYLDDEYRNGRLAYLKLYRLRPHALRQAKDHRRTRRAWLDEIKARPCADCGQSFPSVCMDFDHRPGTKKTFNVGNKPTRSKAAVLAEIAKCDLVCANCHRIRTRNRRNARNENAPV